MKRIFSIFAVLTLIGLFSQKAYGQWAPQYAFGAKAGMNISKTGGNPSGRTLQIGYNVGLTLEYQLDRSRGFYTETGISLTTKGLKANRSKNPNDVEINALYLQVPVYGIYMFSLSESTRLLFKTGPFVAYGVGGKTKEYILDEDGDYAQHKYSSFGDGRLKRFDFGWAGGMGVEFDTVSLQVVGEQGILKTVPFGNKRTRNVSISVAYKY